MFFIKMSRRLISRLMRTDLFNAFAFINEVIINGFSDDAEIISIDEYFDNAQSDI